jgi:hypothetical protein
MEYKTDSEDKSYDLQALDNKYRLYSHEQLADEAVNIASKQLLASTEFKKPRLERIAKYWALYDGKTKKKLRQLFNVPLPVFAGMIDTLNAQYDTPIQIKFSEGDASDYFKVKKINGAFHMETVNTAENSKWDDKLRMCRKHAIMGGRGIIRYDVQSDPEYTSNISNVLLKNFHFQPKGGRELEKHLFAGEEGIEKTKSEIVKGGMSGFYDRKQAYKLITTANDREYLPEGTLAMGTKLERFKPLGLDPDNHSYVGETVYRLCEWILRIDGIRYYLCFDPWTKTWLHFQKWKEMCSSDLYPWVTYATHEDDENFLSKAYGDDLYVAADSIVAMFNQELTNREKRNFGARAYDKDMFKDVRKLDESMHRPDALVPADTNMGSKRISEGIYEFKVGELGGTVNLIDWITASLGTNTGANDLAKGQVNEVSKKASVTFAEQKSVSKRVSWASSSFQMMMAGLGKRYIWGLKDHMPSKMAIKLLGQNGWDWDQITRLDLDTTKDVDVIITSADKQILDNEMKSDKRKEIVTAIGADPVLSSLANPQWRLEEILRTGDWDDVEIAVAMDNKNFADKKALAHAAESIQLILQGVKPDQWFGANVAFIQKIKDFAIDNRSTLGVKYDQLLEYAMSHVEIVKANIERKVQEESMFASNPMVPTAAPAPTPTASNPGISGGVSKAMDIGNSLA